MHFVLVVSSLQMLDGELASRQSQPAAMERQPLRAEEPWPDIGPGRTDNEWTD